LAQADLAKEFLGDWINLSNHQKAACNIITGLYTPQTIMEDEMTRVILGWYIRFDVNSHSLSSPHAFLRSLVDISFCSSPES
jgi:hypothetical protein